MSNNVPKNKTKTKCMKLTQKMTLWHKKSQAKNSLGFYYEKIIAIAI